MNRSSLTLTCLLQVQCCKQADGLQARQCCHHWAAALLWVALGHLTYEPFLIFTPQGLTLNLPFQLADTHAVNNLTSHLTGQKLMCSDENPSTFCSPHIRGAFSSILSSSLVESRTSQASQEEYFYMLCQGPQLSLVTSDNQAYKHAQVSLIIKAERNKKSLGLHVP